MQVSKTYDYSKNDHINRAEIAQLCCSYFGIRDVSPSLYKIAAPVSELAHYNEYGEKITYRNEIDNAIPWDERSMRTFGVVYCYESVASFIGVDGKTYVVPCDQPVLDHLRSCGYVIAPYGENLDGSHNGTDSLIYKETDENNFFNYNIIDRNLPKEILDMIDALEENRPYYLGAQHYAAVVRFGGTFGLYTASEEELQCLSLSEKKIANIGTYGRVFEPGNIEDYVEFALKHYFLFDQNNISKK